MKTLKHIFVMIIVMLMCSTAIAQKKELTDEQKAQMEAQLIEYFEKLNLSEEQKPKFKEVTKKYALQMKDLKDSDKGKLGKYKELKSIRKNKNKELKELLSEEQYKIYEETSEKMQKKMKEKRNEKN